MPLDVWQRKPKSTYFGLTVFWLNMNGEEKEQKGDRKVNKEKRKQE